MTEAIAATETSSPGGLSHMRTVRSRVIRGAAALGAAIVIGCGLSASTAHAGYVVTLEEQGTSVVATGSGAIDLTGLNNTGSTFTPPYIQPFTGTIVTGPGAAMLAYNGFTGPASFGSGLTTLASSGTGNQVGIDDGFLYVPFPYASDAPLSSSATWNGATFSSLGVTPGTYEWTWGDGGGDQNFTLIVGAVPAPPAALLLAVGGLLLFGAKLRARRRSRDATVLQL